MDDDSRKRLLEDPDFILLKRFDFSLQQMLERKQSGVTDTVVAQALGIKESEVQPLLEGVFKKLRRLLR